MSYCLNRKVVCPSKEEFLFIFSVTLNPKIHLYFQSFAHDWRSTEVRRELTTLPFCNFTHFFMLLHYYNQIFLTCLPAEWLQPEWNWSFLISFLHTNTINLVRTQTEWLNLIDLQCRLFNSKLLILAHYCLFVSRQSAGACLSRVCVSVDETCICSAEIWRDIILSSIKSWRLETPVQLCEGVSVNIPSPRVHFKFLPFTFTTVYTILHQSHLLPTTSNFK